MNERLLFGLPTLLFCFAIILMDSAGWISVEKWGYAAIGGWIILLLQFYYRKAKME